MSDKCSCPEPKTVHSFRVTKSLGKWSRRCVDCGDEFSWESDRPVEVFVVEFWEDYDPGHTIRTHHKTKMGAYRSMMEDKRMYWHGMRDACPRWGDGDYTANANWEIKTIKLLD